MASTGQSKGNEILVYVDGVILGYCKDATLTVNNESIDFTTKNAAGWKKILPSLRGFTVEGSGLIVYTDDSFSELEQLIENKTQVELYLKTAVSGDVAWYGNAYCTSISKETPNEDATTFSFTFEGDDLLRSSSWTPDLLTDLELWLDGNDGVTTAGGVVSDWDDKSTNDFDAIQAVGAEQPTHNQTAINSKGAVVFDGSGENLDIDASFRSAINTGVDFTICLVAKKTGSINEDTLFASATATGDMMAISLYSTGWVRCAVYDGTAHSVSMNSGVANDIYHTIILSFNATTKVSTLYVDGVLAVGTTSSTVNGTPGTRLGDLTNSTKPLDGEVAEVIAYSQVLDATDRAAVLSYLNDKYNL